MITILQACNEKKVDLGNGYRFDYDPVISTDYAIFGPDEHAYAITGQVTKFAFDSCFILVEQKPRELIMKNVNINSDISYKEQEILFSKSLIRQYWIINKSNKSKYGPFQKAKYLWKRKELGVPNELQLKEK
jgi:hypothetical protein